MDMTMAFNPGAVLGAGMNFIGGLMAQQQAASQFGAQMALSREQMQRDNTRFWDQWQTSQWMADRNEAFQREGWDRDWHQQQAMLAQQSALQREFAQHGLRWKVDDAKAAGLHPLFALGGGSSFSPVNVGPSISPQGSSISGSGIGQSSLPNPTGGGNPFEGMGQDLSRAIMATQTSREREEDQVSDLSRRHIESQINLNNARANELNRLAATPQGRASMNAQVGPTMPNSMVGPAGQIDAKPSEPISAHRGSADAEAGAHRFVRVVDTPSGVTTLPAKDLNIDDATSPGSGTYHANYSIAPLFGGEASPAVKQRIKERFPNSKGEVYVPFMGWLPRYEGDFLDRTRRFLVPGTRTGHPGQGYPSRR